MNPILIMARDGVEFEIDKISGTQGGTVKAEGTIYLSNIRMVFVTKKPAGNLFAFGMSLLHVHDEKFHQPIFFCTTLLALWNLLCLIMSIGLFIQLIPSRFCSRTAS